MEQTHLNTSKSNTSKQVLTDAFEAAVLGNKAEQAVKESFIIVNYSEKALAVFGNTRPVKDQLKAMGGRFNPKLTHEGSKKAGWIFSKSKKQELQIFLTINKIEQ